MLWDIEGTDEFADWWRGLTEGEREAVDSIVTLLEVKGPTLGFPYSSDIRQSRHGGMRELRIQYRGEPYRVLYAFDPRRTAVLLLGGTKLGDDRWYATNVPTADDLFDTYLAELEAEGLLK